MLKGVGVDCKEPILVLNKIDACEDRSIVDVLRAKYEGAVIISATDRTGIDVLERAVAERLQGLLAAIRAGCEGEARARPEAHAAEAPARHLQLAEGRRRAEDALADLRARHAELAEALYGLLLRLTPDEGATRH